jgi:hypothetical protein
MTMLKRWVLALFVILVQVSVLLAQPPEAQTEFVPIDELPPTEQLPAAPFLVAAYAFVWLAAMYYLWTIWSRLGKVEREIQALRQRGQGSGPR